MQDELVQEAPVQETPVQEAPVQEAPAEPAKEPAVTETDPWEGMSETDRIRQAREIYRKLDKDARKASEVMMRLNVQERLERDRQGRSKYKFTDEDIARTRAELEAQYKPLMQMTEAEKAFEESIKDYSEETKEALRAQNKHFMSVFESTVNPLKEKLTAIEKPLQTAEENARIEGIIRAVTSQTPAPEGLILHLIEANKSLPQEEQAQTPDDFARTAEVIMDDWTNHFIPKRVEMEDKPTLEVFKTQLFKALDANKPWANDIRNHIVEKYTGTKMPSEPGVKGREEQPQTSAPVPWDPYAASLGRK